MHGGGAEFPMSPALSDCPPEAMCDAAGLLSFRPLLGDDQGRELPFVLQASPVRGTGDLILDRGKVQE